MATIAADQLALQRLYHWERSAGQTVTLTHHRFGLSGGRDFAIVRLREDTTTERTLLELVG